ncbi:MAG: hypothetical protein SGJ09_10190 [Phycisphaerae bacterium]|nr:hypothetical protein [Phycisphaerae bacterium]
MSTLLPHDEPLHPHPLSNDLTTDALPRRGAREILDRAGGIRPTTRGNLWMLVVVVGVVGLIAIISTAFLTQADWRLALIGIPAIGLFLVFVAGPVLLAIKTKSSQDKAVRDGASAQVARMHVGPEDTGTAEDAAALRADEAGRGATGRGGVQPL